MAQTLLQHSRNVVVTWNAWQMRDIDSQRGDLMGTLFGKDGTAKSSYYAVQKAFLNYANQAPN